MLIPRDLRRLSSPLLRARFTAHLLDEPRPDFAEIQEIFVDAVTALLDSGLTITDISAFTKLPEREIRRHLMREVPAPTVDLTVLDQGEVAGPPHPEALPTSPPVELRPLS